MHRLGSPRRATLALLLGFSLAGITPSPGAAEDQPPVVAAAADLKFALEHVAAAFHEDTGAEVRLAFGSSGNFFRQIQQDAPFQMFLSADEQFAFDLARAGYAIDEGALYAVGRIVVIVPHGSPLKADGTLAALRAALDDGRVEKFAIANPEHAPYGRRAEEALRHTGLWEQIKGRLVLGENVAQATQFATAGATQGGIVAYSLALSPEVSKLGSFALIPQDWHQPLRQRMVLLKGAGETAKRFYAYVQEPAARAIFRRFGFVLPGESS